MTKIKTKDESLSCTDIKQLFADHLIGDLSKNKSNELKKHLNICISCNNEFEELTSIWSELGILPEIEPSENLRKNFYEMLNSYQIKTEKTEKFKISEIGNFIKSLWPKQPIFKLGFALMFLVIGFFGGYKATFIENKDKFEVKQLEIQSDQLKHHLTMSLLDQSSPSERIKGLSWSTKVQSPNEKLISSILNTLDNDLNVNVRLSAVEALYLFSDNPIVKTGLVNSLQNQSSPIVQVALIDLLVELREKRGVAALKELIKKQKINPDVKNMAEKSLKKLL